MVENILQMVTTLLGISAALYIVLQPHPVLAVLSLILLAFVTAVRWWSYGAFFFSLILLLIYLGAVLVLFLFVVMTLSQDHKFLEISRRSWRIYQSIVLAVSFGYLYQHIAGNSIEQSAKTYVDLSAHHVAQVLSARSEVLMQWVGLFLLLAMLVSVMLLSKKSVVKKEE